MVSPTPDEFREAVSRFATGITVVTCVVDGVDHAMTANAFASVSLDPLLVLVCVERESRFHEAIAATHAWGVSILPADAEPTARWLATKGRPLARSAGAIWSSSFSTTWRRLDRRSAGSH